MPKKLIPILFRADASHVLGAGHIMRCVALANGFSKKIRAIFVMRNYSGSEAILPIITQQGWRVHILPHTMSEEKEIQEIQALTLEMNCTLIVTDLVTMSVFSAPLELAAYHKKLRCIPGLYVVSIEDNRLTNFTSHMAIIGNTIYPAREKRENDHCLLLEGAKYFICHENVALQTKKPHIINRAGNRVLVFIGGSDVAGVTAHLLSAFQEAVVSDDLRVKVILGPTMAQSLREQIIQLAKKLQYVELIEFTNKIGDLLRWADLAVVGEGTIKFEAAIVATPMLLITQFDHDSKPIRDFLSTGCAKHLKFSNKLAKKEIVNAIFSLLEDYSARLAMSTSAKKFFDGKAVEYISHKLSKVI